MLVNEPDADAQSFLDDQINNFNMRVTGRTDYEPITYVLRDQDGTIVAGIAAFTWGGGCEIKALWVHERWRGHGIGSRLLGMVEREARQQGASVAMLDTYDFQAPRLLSPLRLPTRRHRGKLSGRTPPLLLSEAAHGRIASNLRMRAVTR